MAKGTVALSQLLNYPGLESLVSLGDFIRKDETNKDKEHLNATIAGMLLNRPFSSKIVTNGAVYLEPSAAEIKAKIRFAFIGPDTSYIRGNDEPRDTEVLSSLRPTSRSLYQALPLEHKVAIQKHIQEMFSITLESSDRYSIFAVQNDQKVEIMFQGAAFRKVFATFAILYTLASAIEHNRILLIEEPEALLYPTLQRKLLEVLFEVTTTYQIQLIVTSNSDLVIRSFSPRETFVLMGSAKPDVGHHMHRHKWVKKAVDHHLLGVEPSKPLVLCEGADDEHFVTTMASFFGLGAEVSKVQFRHFPDLSSSKSLQKLATKLATELEITNVLFLRDLDFRMTVQPGINKDREFFWDFPATIFLFITAKRTRASCPLPLPFSRTPIMPKHLPRITLIHFDPRMSRLRTTTWR
jgi:hypothetical protein